MEESYKIYFIMENMNTIEGNRTFSQNSEKEENFMVYFYTLYCIDRYTLYIRRLNV